MKTNKDGFFGWFDRESGYTLHRRHVPVQQLVDCCCGKKPEKTSLEAIIPNRDGTEKREQLYFCCICHNWFFQGDKGYYPAGSLLQYQITKGGEVDAEH